MSAPCPQPRRTLRSPGFRSGVGHPPRPNSRRQPRSQPWQCSLRADPNCVRAACPPPARSLAGFYDNLGSEAGWARLPRSNSRRPSQHQPWQFSLRVDPNCTRDACVPLARSLAGFYDNLGSEAGWDAEKARVGWFLEVLRGPLGRRAPGTFVMKRAKPSPGASSS